MMLLTERQSRTAYVKTLLGPEAYDALLENGHRYNALIDKVRDGDFRPLVRLHSPGRAYSWLLSRIDPVSPLIAYGVSDFDLYDPHIGYMDISAFADYEASYGLPIVRCPHFTADKTIREYAADALRCPLVVS